MSGVHRTIFIHIGTHKTGTTSIQAFLRRYADSLRGCGICVPSSGTLTPLSGHHRIAWEIWDDPRLPDTFRNSIDHLISEIDESCCQRAVISAEGLGFLVEQPQNLQHLENRLVRAGWTPVYIVFFRRPDEYAASLYQTLVRLGVRTSFLRFAIELLIFGTFRAGSVWTFYVDRQRFMQQWKSAARGRIVAVDYDKAKQESLILVFMRIIGARDVADLPAEPLGVRSNSTPLLHRLISLPIKWRYQ